ncbi:TauD/TfdA family dioxygenase [Microbacterium sp. SORGH_AS_0888]|uniref:TauD/TfdA family dioxygenase n=1 Tax=Microbacterium sp. SORGH_AS_0888 TaxID=3041791 RepID=UPI0027827811|nr:TauD/TfdA family dioxygenase [Microbacterium sp. SORGH_AS_0888]MDQ1129412.1 L-asparagine oxygenase [Microbacterium sp. SORGH_AS_0888]
MIERTIAPEVAEVFIGLARGRRGLYRDDDQLEQLIADAKAALETADPETVEIIRRFARAEVPDGGVLFHGLLVDQEQMGESPRNAADFEEKDRDPVTEAALLAFAAAAGEVFAFARQHRGQIVQNVTPVPGHEYDAVGTGSRSLLDWHSEDAFDDAHPQFVGLFCVRGDERVQTALAPVDRIALSDEDEAVLRQPRFMHGIDKASGGTGRPEDGVQGAALYGDDGKRFVRIDTDCAAAVAGDEEAAAALQRFHDGADAEGVYVTLGAGDILLFDNRRVMHARTPFEPRYDGTDRWLQRVIITDDLGRSEGRRSVRPRVVENELLNA